MTETLPDIEWRADVLILESLDFAPDAGMFCAVSDSLVSLRAVAKMLGKLENRSVVADLIEHVDLTEYD